MAAIYHVSVMDETGETSRRTSRSRIDPSPRDVRLSFKDVRSFGGTFQTPLASNKKTEPFGAHHPQQGQSNEAVSSKKDPSRTKSRVSVPAPTPPPDDETNLITFRGDGVYGLRIAWPAKTEDIALSTTELWGVKALDDGAGPQMYAEPEKGILGVKSAIKLAGARAWLKAERLVEHELPPAEKIPDDALAAALRCGFVTNIAVVDALEINGQASVCLCCYRVHGARRARALARQLQLIQRYYDEEAYALSGAMYRNLRALISDVPRDVQHQIKAYVNALDTTPAAIREANHWPGLCLAAPECGQARVLWVYSTAHGRRFLRKLGKRCRAPTTEPEKNQPTAAEQIIRNPGASPSLGFGPGPHQQSWFDATEKTTQSCGTMDFAPSSCLNVQISIAVADPSIMPKFWYKMYVARLDEGGEGDEARTTKLFETFWSLVVAVAEQVGSRQKNQQRVKTKVLAAGRGQNSR